MSSAEVRDRATVYEAAFRRTARASWRLVGVTLALVVLGLVVKYAWVVIFPVVMALILTTVLGPPAAFLRRRKVPSALAALISVVSFLVIVFGSFALLAPSVAGQVGDIASSAVSGLQRVQTWVSDGPLNVSSDQVDRAINALQERVQDSAAAIGSGVFSTLSAATSAIINLVVILMLTFFFSKDGHKFLPWVTRIGGARVGGHLCEILRRCWKTLGGFIRTQGLVSLIDAVLIGAGLLILDVPLAIPLAVITFFGGFIPIVGAFVSGALAVLVSLVTNDVQTALIVVAIIVAVQQLEGNVLSPWLQGKTMNLHAAVVLLSVTAGGTLFGITGAFLAVPAAATAAELLRYLIEQTDEAVDEAAPAVDAVGSIPPPRGDELPSEAETAAEARRIRDEEAASGDDVEVAKTTDEPRSGTKRS
ncbi:AI-2E family transporter [Solicola sp. PLA-1-18]|uniref:AI-2E family transporter n=1 Tax=Solicola sp. PLA-1-18 TaxID=3380532 RepID=UPI003B77B3C6